MSLVGATSVDDLMKLLKTSRGRLLAKGDDRPILLESETNKFTVQFISDETDRLRIFIKELPGGQG